MADLMVLLVVVLMSLQVLIFGGFLLLAAMDPQKDARPSTYQPMEILLARAARAAAAAAPVEHPKAA